MEDLLHWYAAKLIRVVDGDTVKLAVDMGFGNVHTANFRLAEINCPEINTDAGKAARDYVQSWFTRRGYVCLVKTVKEDKYGRYLADIRDAKNISDCLNDELVSQQLAVSYMVGR